MPLPDERKIIESYLKLKKNPTLQKIADDTGLERTRVYRIFKEGKEMRLNEYKIFVEKLLKLQNKHNVMSLTQFAQLCELELSKSSIHELKIFLQTKLQKRDIASCVGLLPPMEADILTLKQ